MKKPPLRFALGGLASLLFAPCLFAQDFPSELGIVRVTTVADGLEHPWAVAVLPSGRMLVTERPGRMRIVTADGAVSVPLQGVPAVYASGQGGMLDVVYWKPTPDSLHNIYFSYAEPGSNGTAGTTVARARLNGNALRDVEVIFRQNKVFQSNVHFGGRLVPTPTGHLFVTLGERGERIAAQDRSRLQGVIVRILPDGGIPPDNPFVGIEGMRPEIWSYGHRNPQGATLHWYYRTLWAQEHGPLGGDEVNIPQAGRNYGWPIITYGLGYDGNPIPESEGTHKPGMQQPRHYWVPTSIAPSGLAFYHANRFPAWRGNLFLGALAGRKLVRLKTNGYSIVHEEALITGLNARIRDVRQGRDGYLYLLTDSSNGRVLKVELLP